MSTKAFQGKEGVHFVQGVLNAWEDVWIDFPADHDQGIDGLIQFNRSIQKESEKDGKLVKTRDRVPTGHLMMIQVKCGPSYLCNAKSVPDKVRINLTEGYIEKHRPIWNAFTDPVIVVYVLPKGHGRKKAEAWWTDLKSPNSYSKTNKNVICFPKDQTFGVQSKGEICKLLSKLRSDQALPKIDMTKNPQCGVRLNEMPKKTARKFYQEWSDAPISERTNSVFGEVNVSRAGWRHITRRGRSSDRILQSFHLLPSARAMLIEVRESGCGYLGHYSERTVHGTQKVIRDYVGLRAMVLLRHRGPTVVQVVLRRRRVIDLATQKIETKVWFHSVYELRRGVRLEK